MSNMDEIRQRIEAQRAKNVEDREHLLANVSEWEPSYGFCAMNETDRVALAMTLEAIRRQVCCYGGGNRCDCKYGLRVERGAQLQEFGVAPAEGERSIAYRGIRMGSSEQTGCPELREIIHRLLHRDVPLI